MQRAYLMPSLTQRGCVRASNRGPSRATTALLDRVLGVLRSGDHQ
jgi:hypothetical protein